MILPKTKVIHYRPKESENAEYLEMFFLNRIAELVSIKQGFENDKIKYTQEADKARRGEGKFTHEYLEGFIQKINEKILDVNDCLAINRFHLYNEAIQ